MESRIDERYRLKLLEYYLGNSKEMVLHGGSRKWIFVCPFCGSLGRTEGKRTHRKGSLLWNAQQHSWVFSCAKKGSVECMNNKTFGNLISTLNPALGEAYKQDRWHSGTTGKGHNIGAPRSITGIGTTGHGFTRSNRAPLPSTNQQRCPYVSSLASSNLQQQIQGIGKHFISFFA